jgi:hypothetical protein
MSNNICPSIFKKKSKNYFSKNVIHSNIKYSYPGCNRMQYGSVFVLSQEGTAFQNGAIKRTKL